MFVVLEMLWLLVILELGMQKVYIRTLYVANIIISLKSPTLILNTLRELTENKTIINLTRSDTHNPIKSVIVRERMVIYNTYSYTG